MELSWVVPWYRSLTPATYAVSPMRAFLVLASLFLSVHMVVRLMNFLRLRLDLRRWVLLILFVACVLVGLKTLLYPNESVWFGELLSRPLRSFNDYAVVIPDEFVVTLVVLLTCWRGMSLAQEFIEPLTVLRNFQMGILLFIAYIFILTNVTGETPGLFLYIFLFAALIAMGAARIGVLSTLRGGGGSPFDRRWSAGMLMATLCVVGLAALAARLASEGGLLEQIGAATLGIIILFAVVVISPAIFFLPVLIQRFPGLSGRLVEFVDNLREIRANLFGIAQNLFGLLDRTGFLDFVPALKPVLLWSVILGVGFVILLQISRWLSKDRQGRSEERESLLGRGDLLRLIQEALRNQLRKASEGLMGAVRLRHSQRLLAAARIRRIYSQLMDLSAELDTPRPSAKTPLEFLPDMSRLFPAYEDNLADITQAYLRVRYGELPETLQEVQEVERAWARIAAAGQELVGRKKQARPKK